MGTCLKEQSFPNQCFKGQWIHLREGPQYGSPWRHFIFAENQVRTHMPPTERGLLECWWSKAAVAEVQKPTLSEESRAGGVPERPQSSERQVGNESWTLGGCGDFIRVQWKGAYTCQVFADPLFFLPPTLEGPLCAKVTQIMDQEWAVCVSDAPMALVCFPHPYPGHADNCGPWLRSRVLERPCSLIKETAWKLGSALPTLSGFFCMLVCSWH